MLKYYLIVNPASGHKRGQIILKQVIKKFEKAGIEIRYDLSTHSNHPFELAKEKDLDGIDAIIIIGGDGTIHEVINGLLNREDGKRLPLGIIPAGTGNSLMHDLDCLDPKAAVDKILKNNLSAIDIFEIITGDIKYYGFNILGWGVPVDINLFAEKIRWFGPQRYNLASLIELIRNRARAIRITIDDKTFEGEYSFFLACNTMYTGNGMKMAPQAILDDGWLDVFLIKKASRLKLLSLFVKVFSGKHIGNPAIQVFKAKSFSLHTLVPQPLNIDGQNFGTTPVQVNMTGIQLSIFI